MTSDYAHEPELQFAERRGISFRDRVDELVRKEPEKVRGMFDGLRLPVERPVEPERSPEDAARQKRRRIVARPARAVVRIFESFDKGPAADPGQVPEIHEARNALNALREHAAIDLENPLNKEQPLPHPPHGGHSHT